MKSKLTISLIVSIAAIFLLIGCSKDDSKILVKVGSYSIAQKDFEERYSNYLLSSGIKDSYRVRTAILNNMTNEILLYNYDDNKSIFENPEYQKELDWNKKQVLLSYLKDQEIHSKLTADEKELRETFFKVNEKIAARHLFAETLDEAENYYQLLQVGNSFEELAKQCFTDSVLANNGGYLGYFTWGDMDPNFEEVAYSMKKGEISKPVKTQYGYSIIKVEDRQQNPIMTESQFLKKRNHLTKVVKLRKKKPAEQKYLSNVIDLSKIKFSENILDNFWAQLSGEVVINDEAKDSKASEICATYKNQSYTVQEVKEKINSLPYYHRSKINSKKKVKTIIKGFFLQDELLKIAEDKKYDEVPLVLKTKEKMLNGTFLKYKRNQIVSDAQFPDSTLKLIYNENINNFSTDPQINVQEIIVEDELLAKKLVSKLNEGQAFGTLAQKHSVRKLTKSNNGKIGLSSISRFGKFKNTFWESELNKIIGPVQFENYYGIFRVTEKVESKPLNFETVKNQVKLFARHLESKKTFSNHIENLHSKVKIEVDEELLKKIKI